MPGKLASSIRYSGARWHRIVTRVRTALLVMAGLVVIGEGLCVWLLDWYWQGYSGSRWGGDAMLAGVVLIVLGMVEARRP